MSNRGRRSLWTRRGHPYRPSHNPGAQMIAQERGLAQWGLSMSAIGARPDATAPELAGAASMGGEAYASLTRRSHCCASRSCRTPRNYNTAAATRSCAAPDTRSRIFRMRFSVLPAGHIVSAVLPEACMHWEWLGTASAECPLFCLQEEGGDPGRRGGHKWRTRLR